MSIAQDSLTRHADDFKNDPNLQVSILGPRAEKDEKNAGGLLYPDKTEKMAKTIASILDIDYNAIQQESYVGVDKNKDIDGVLDNTAAGHMIFDYDPKAGDRREPFAWRIIWERSQILGHQWSATK